MIQFVLSQQIENFPYLSCLIFAIFVYARSVFITLLPIKLSNNQLHKFQEQEVLLLIALTFKLAGTYHFALDIFEQSLFIFIWP